MSGIATSVGVQGISLRWCIVAGLFCFIQSRLRGAWFVMAVRGSEFGGVPGRVQPLPHELTGAERARLERAVDPTDDQGNAETQRIAEAGKRGVGPVDPAGDLA